MTKLISLLEYSIAIHTITNHIKQRLAMKSFSVWSRTLELGLVLKGSLL